eukprot:1243111-Rhodomonas_salina.8
MEGAPKAERLLNTEKAAINGKGCYKRNGGTRRQIRCVSTGHGIAPYGTPVERSTARYASTACGIGPYDTLVPDMA